MDPYFATNIAKGRLNSNLELAEQLRLERRLNPRHEGLLSGLYPLLKKLASYPLMKASPVAKADAAGIARAANGKQGL